MSNKAVKQTSYLIFNSIQPYYRAWTSWHRKCKAPWFAEFTISQCDNIVCVIKSACCGSILIGQVSIVVRCQKEC